MAYVLVYDLLFGHGVQCGGPLKKCMSKHVNRLKSELTKLKVRAKVREDRDLLPDRSRDDVALPRYARVNTLQCSIAAAHKALAHSGFSRVPAPALLLDLVKLRPKTYCVDTHLSELLVFPPQTDFHEHPLYTSGGLILQDKASCFPAAALSPPPGSVCIDGCAAPGNKTSHLASRLNNTGTIFAFDIDARRFDTMNRLHKRAGASCVKPKLQSFLETDPTDPLYADVEYILLDPSCSGSGIVSRKDWLVEDEEEGGVTDDERLHALASFQLRCIQHAMAFPNIRLISYSTCSVHQIENEDVVAAALKGQEQTFRLRTALPSWPRRGLPVIPGAAACVRADMHQDATIGFFVALFERVSKSDDATRASRSDSTNVQASAGAADVAIHPSTSDSKRKRNRKKKERTRKRKAAAAGLGATPASALTAGAGIAGKHTAQSGDNFE
jgi:putative methyltransferase